MIIKITLFLSLPIIDIMPRTKAIKPSIDKYIFLFSKHASATSSGGMTTEYNWNIDPQMINEQCSLEIAQKSFGQETAYATATFVSATTGNSNIQTSNPNLSFVPSTGILSATKFSGTGATLTGLTSGASTDSVVTINAAGVLNKRDMYNNKSYYTINQSADSSYFTIQSINGLLTDTVKILVTANGVSYVPYTQADSDVDLGLHSISANSFIKSGGTSYQFLKADGSVDSSTYISRYNETNCK